jgi:hypothetical protein
MKKLNNKGYLLVEIIVASVLAMSIAYFLINLTIKFSKTDEDIYQSISWINDKNIITNMIMEDSEKYLLSSTEIVTNDAEKKEIKFSYYDEENDKYIDKNLIIENNTIKYYDDENNYDYENKIDSALTVGEINISTNSDNIEINIPMTSIYSNEDYGIKLFIPYAVIGEEIETSINTGTSSTANVSKTESLDGNVIKILSVEVDNGEVISYELVGNELKYTVDNGTGTTSGGTDGDDADPDGVRYADYFDATWDEKTSSYKCSSGWSHDGHCFYCGSNETRYGVWCVTCNSPKYYGGALRCKIDSPASTYYSYVITVKYLTKK